MKYLEKRRTITEIQEMILLITNSKGMFQAGVNISNFLDLIKEDLYRLEQLEK